MKVQFYHKPSRLKVISTKEDNKCSLFSSRQSGGYVTTADPHRRLGVRAGWVAGGGGGAWTPSPFIEIFQVPIFGPEAVNIRAITPDFRAATLHPPPPFISFPFLGLLQLSGVPIMYMICIAFPPVILIGYILCRKEFSGGSPWKKFVPVRLIRGRGGGVNKFAVGEVT